MIAVNMDTFNNKNFPEGCSQYYLVAYKMILIDKVNPKL